MAWLIHLEINSIWVVIIKEIWLGHTQASKQRILLIIRRIMAIFRHRVTPKLMAQVCQWDHWYLALLHLPAKAANSSHITPPSNKHKISILAWTKFFLRTLTQPKLPLSRTFSTCLQMFKICWKILRKHLIKVRGYSQHLMDQVWATNPKPWPLSIVLGSRIETISVKLPSQLKKALKISTIHFSLTNTTRNPSREVSQISDPQSTSDRAQSSNCWCRMQVWSKWTNQNQQQVIEYLENKVSIQMFFLLTIVLCRSYQIEQ